MKIIETLVVIDSWRDVALVTRLTDDLNSTSEFEWRRDSVNRTNSSEYEADEMGDSVNRTNPTENEADETTRTERYGRTFCRELLSSCTKLIRPLDITIHRSTNDSNLH